MGTIIVKKLLFVTAQDVKDFCTAANTLPRNADIYLEHNEFKVSGKSIAGIFSLDLSNPVTMTVSIPDSLEFDTDKFLGSVSRWCV